MANNNYDEDQGRYLDHDDIEYAVNNGVLQETSYNSGVYRDADGNEYDSEYNKRN